MPFGSKGAVLTHHGPHVLGIHLLTVNMEIGAVYISRVITAVILGIRPGVGKSGLFTENELRKEHKIACVGPVIAVHVAFFAYYHIFGIKESLPAHQHVEHIYHAVAVEVTAHIIQQGCVVLIHRVNDIKIVHPEICRLGNRYFQAAFFKL